MNNVKLTIGGINYSVKTDKESDYTLNLAGEIDSALSELLASGGFITRDQALILLTLSYADRTKELEAQTEELRSKLRASLEDSAKAKQERDAAQRELKQKKAKKLAQED